MSIKDYLYFMKVQILIQFFHDKIIEIGLGVTLFETKTKSQKELKKSCCIEGTMCNYE